MGADQPHCLAPGVRTQRVETIADEQKCLGRVASRSFNPRKVAYVESELAATLPAECRGSAEITRETPTEILVSATMETAGMLVLADRWDQGWKAYASCRRRSGDAAGTGSPSPRDGKPVPIRQVNYAVRGVELPAGKSEIIFRYEPAGLTWGLRLGGLAVLIMLGSLAWIFTMGPLEGPSAPERLPPPTDRNTQGTAAQFAPQGSNPGRKQRRHR